jgi:hypothetical protein
MQADPGIGIAGAKLLYPDGTIQFAGGRIDGPRGYTYHLGWHEPDKGQWDILGDVDFVTGASLAITRQALDHIGYEDERFFPIDYEDPDMSYRARAAGYRVVLVPQAVAIHHESSTSRASEISRVLPLEAGRVRFVCKHWPAGRLREEFLPAELDFLCKGPSLNRQVLRWVYLKTLHDIDDLIQWRAQLSVGSRAESETVLTEVLNQLRTAWYAEVGPPPLDRVDEILQAWFAPDLQSGEGSTPAAVESQGLLLTLSRLDGHVEPHQPIAWPEWPPGLWPKVKAALKKLTRRSLRWYINPIVRQQNEINAALLYALETLTQKVTLLQDQQPDGDPGDQPDSARQR